MVEALAEDRQDDGAAPTDAFAVLAGSPALELKRMLADIRSILEGPTIQARCLECGPGTASAPTVKADRGLLSLLAEWLA